MLAQPDEIGVEMVVGDDLGESEGESKSPGWYRPYLVVDPKGDPSLNSGFSLRRFTSFSTLGADVGGSGRGIFGPPNADMDSGVALRLVADLQPLASR